MRARAGSPILFVLQGFPCNFKYFSAIWARYNHSIPPMALCGREPHGKRGRRLTPCERRFSFTAPLFDCTALISGQRSPPMRVFVKRHDNPLHKAIFAESLVLWVIIDSKVWEKVPAVSVPSESLWIPSLLSFSYLAL